MIDRDSPARACRYIEYMLTTPLVDTYAWNELIFEIDRGVFSPVHSTASAFFAAKIAAIASGKRVLEFGCGCGIIAVAAAYAGATRVVATEINPISVRCANRNVRRLGFADRVTVVETSGTDFDDDDFDVVFSALPYVYTDNVSEYVRRYGPIAYSMFDERYQFQRTVMRYFNERQTSGGELYLGFGIAGDLGMFDRNAAEFSLSPVLVDTQSEDGSDNRFYQMLTALDFLVPHRADTRHRQLANRSSRGA